MKASRDHEGSPPRRGPSRLSRFMSEAQERRAYRRMASIRVRHDRLFQLFQPRRARSRPAPARLSGAGRLAVPGRRAQRGQRARLWAARRLHDAARRRFRHQGSPAPCSSAASLLRATTEIFAGAGSDDGGRACWRARTQVESRERRYAAITGLFSLALALVQWFVLTRPAGEPFRLITVAGGLIFLVSAPARACGVSRAVAFQTA